MEETDFRSAVSTRLFRAPFSLTILLLALCGWGSLRIGVAIIEWLTARDYLLDQFITSLLRTVLPVPSSLLSPNLVLGSRLEPVFFLLILLLLIGSWALFGVSICRTVAVRLARDEILSFKEAFLFAWQTKSSSFLYAGILSAILMFLYLASGFAGLIAGIPWIGPLVLVPLLPLVVLASLIFTAVTFGGVLGMGLATSALATERNGTLDAVSRTYSYIFSRPLYFIFAYTLVILFAKLLHWAGDSLFLSTLQNSLGSIYESQSLRAMLDAALRRPGFDFAALTPTQWIGAMSLWVTVALLKLGIASLVIGYVLSAGTCIYFILREEVDGTPRDDIDIGLRIDEPVEAIPPIDDLSTEEKEDDRPDDEPDPESDPASQEPPSPSIPPN